MGIPDDISSRPVAKRQRLSLKNNKGKSKTQESSTQNVREVCDSESGTSASNTDVSSVGTGSSLSSESITESSTTTSNTDVYCSTSKEEIRVPAVASLENLGNTCFMNSVMQVLRYTPGFLHDLAILYQDIQESEKVVRKTKKDDSDNKDAKNSKGCWNVVKNIYKIYRNLTLLEKKYDDVATDDVMSMAAKPNKVLAAVRELNAMYVGNMQHDAQEFLKCLLCYLQDAEKDVKRFYSYLPQKLSPKVNPIMHSFLLSAKSNPEARIKMEKIINEINNNPEKLNICESMNVVEADKVKTKLFTETETDCPNKRSDEKKSETQLNSSECVTNKKSVDDHCGQTKMEAESPENNTEKEACSSSACSNLSVQETVPDDTAVSKTGKIGKEKNSRTAKRYKPYDKKSQGKKSKLSDTSKDVDNKSEVSSQPCISDIFKTYSKKKRLGIRGAVVKQPGPNFDEIVKNDIQDSERKCYVDLDKIMDPAPCKLNEVKKETNVNNVPKHTDEKMDVDKTDDNVKTENQSKSVNNASENVKVEQTKKLKIFQEAFLHFLNTSNQRSDSDETHSDTDSEDIVTKKIKEKLIHNSPRRSPRKVKSEACLPSPCKTAVSKLALDSKSDANIRSAQYKLKFDVEVKNIKDETGENISSNACALSASEDIPVGDKVDDPEMAAGENEVTPNKENKSPAPVALDPVVKLEKCDYVFDGASTSVSARYAVKCLSPMKPERKYCTGVGNYLKERNDLASNEADIKKAFLEMMNSPVKSRSKYDLVERYFQGTMMLRTRCSTCETAWERQEDFHDISVPVRIDTSDSDVEDDDTTGFSLFDLIKSSTDVERLQEDNKYKCDVCKAYVEAERSVHYDVMPDILTLHLKRFSAQLENPSYITKINDHVNIPLSLPCIRYKCQQSCHRPDHRYMLYGIITHAGSSLTSGHYLSYVRSLPLKSEKSLTEVPANMVNKPEIAEESVSSEIIKQDSKMPATRRKLGVQTKLPARFNDSIVTDTKIKTVKNVAANKISEIVDSIMPAQKYDGMWFECNDESIRVFDEEEFLDLINEKSGSLLGTPYLLFYHKSTLNS